MTLSTPHSGAESLDGQLPAHCVARDPDDPRFAAELLGALVESKQSVIVLTTAREAEVLRALGLHARRAGHTVYQWSADVGLKSLREGDITVPSSRKLVDALRYAQQSPHFGIYLFSADALQLGPSILGSLRQFVRTKFAVEKRLVFLVGGDRIPEGLGELAARIDHRPAGHGPLKLRDGRWVR